MTQKLALETVPSMKSICASDMNHPLLRRIICSRSNTPNSKLPGCPPHLPPLSAKGSEEPASAEDKSAKKTKVTD